MANNAADCFVLAFARSGDGEFRTEAAIKAQSQQHARSAAFQMAAMNRGAIAFAGDPAVGEWGDAEVLARFGDVPEDHELHRQFGTLAGASPLAFAHATPTAHTLLSWLSKVMPFVTRRESKGPETPKRWLAISLLAAVGLAASASVALIIEASAKQRDARLLEMARPACSHSGTTNEELLRLVKSEFTIGTSKKHALRAVVILCQANSQPS